MIERNVTCDMWLLQGKKELWGLKIQWEEHLVGEGQASSGKKSLQLWMPSSNPSRGKPRAALLGRQQGDMSNFVVR